MPRDQPYVWLFPERGCKVVLSVSSFEAVLSSARAALPNETGGTLVGKYSDEGCTATITHPYQARKGAHAGRNWFFRPSDDVDPTLRDLLNKKRDALHYLGEWHSHPGAKPLPSVRDIRTLQGLAHSPDVASDTPLLLILGGNLNRLPQVACFMFAEGIYYRGILASGKAERSPGLTGRLLRQIRHIFSLRTDETA